MVLRFQIRGQVIGLEVQAIFCSWLSAIFALALFYWPYHIGFLQLVVGYIYLRVFLWSTSICLGPPFMKFWRFLSIHENWVSNSSSFLVCSNLKRRIWKYVLNLTPLGLLLLNMHAAKLLRKLETGIKFEMQYCSLYQFIASKQDMLWKLL